MKLVLQMLGLGMATFLVITGCSGSSSTTQNKQEVEEQTKLQQIYNAITGTYSGLLQTSSGPQSVELALYTLSEPAGSNPDGSPKFRIVLKANYRKISPAGPSTILAAQYIPETATLTMLNGSSTLSADDIHTIDSKIQGDVITGQVKRLAGVWGDLSLKLSSRETTAPNDGDTNQYYDRLRAQYKAIAGIFTGVVVPPAQIAAPYSIQIRLYTIEVNTPTGAQPLLQGYYHLDQDTSSDLDFELAITYKTDLNPAQIVMTGKYATSAYSVSIDGFFVGTDQIQASLLHKGVRAPVVLKKK